MEQEKPARTHKPSPEKESHTRRPTTGQVLWATGMMVALVVIVLFVVQLLIGPWQAPSGEDRKTRIVLFMGILVALGVVIALFQVRTSRQRQALVRGLLFAVGTPYVRRQVRARPKPSIGSRMKILSILGILLTVLAVIALIRIGYSVGWTGFGQHQIVGTQEVQPRKTLWDWLDLLVIPLVLAVGGYLLNRAERKNTQDAENQRAQDSALQSFLDQVGELMRDEDWSARGREEARGELHTLVRARTLAVLPRLDGDRKKSVIVFLHESHLIEGDEPVVTLGGAELSGANLGPVSASASTLRGINLSETNLRGSNLRGVDLTEAHLLKANLALSSLLSAKLERAHLNSAFILAADLRGANLRSAHLEDALLAHAYLCGFRFRRIARLRSILLTFLLGAHMTREGWEQLERTAADLSEANLCRANLANADLRNANLHGADLSQANLTAAKVTKEQLASCKSLKGATMPNGQTYEEWLHSKSIRGIREDGRPIIPP